MDKLNRRNFIAGAGALGLAACSPDPKSADLIIDPLKSNSGFSILQGLTTETTTQLSVDLEKSLQVVYVLTDVDTKKEVSAESIKPVTFGDSKVRVDKIKYVGLELGHKYQLLVKDKKRNKVLDERYLTTVDLSKKDARIAIMSCMNDGKSARSQIWPSAEVADLDYMFFIGDNVYGDMWIMHGPSYLWSRYVETRKNIPYYHWKNLKPVIAVWDDHDFGKNNAGGDYKHKDSAFRTFKTFFAQEPDGQTLVNGYANSCILQAFGQNFVFFDNRYYRGLKNAKGDKGFLGIEQIDWMSKAVSSRPKPTWLMQGAPMFGRIEKMSSYQANAPEELDYFLGKVRSWGVPTIFAGGDLHYTEVSSVAKSVLGYNSYELISSCMHSNTKSAFYDNPNPQLKGFLKENFLVLEQTGGAGNPVWKVECIGKSSTLPFTMELKVG